MKVDIVKLIIALAISALLAYACYEICKFEHVQWLITCGAFITIGIPASLALGISAKEERGSVMLKALAWIVLLIEIVANFIFVFFDFSVPVYVITNGLVLLIFILIYNAMYRTHM